MYPMHFKCISCLGVIAFWLPVFGSDTFLEDSWTLFILLFVLEEDLRFVDCWFWRGGGDVAALARSFVEPSCATGVE